jgi:hypothetical protein
MQCTTAALCGAISILFAGCSTIVKGTEQQVSVNTPGVPGALCQLQSPAIGTRTVQTPANITLPKSKNNVAVSCTAQCYSPGVNTLASHTEAMAAGNVLHRPRHRCSLRRHEHLRSWCRGHHDAPAGLWQATGPQGERHTHGEHASPNAGAARLGLSLKQAFR